MRGVREGLDKVVKGERGLVDTAEREVLPLEGGRLGLLGVGGGGGDGGLGRADLTGADVTGLGTKEEVEDGLEPIDLAFEN